MKNAGKACNNRLYRHIRTFEKIVKNYFVIYVKPAYRKRGLASEMITFAEAYCSKNYPLDKYELLTGQENLVAQTVYNKLGYVDDNELHLSKQVRK